MIETMNCVCRNHISAKIKLSNNIPLSHENFAAMTENEIEKLIPLFSPLKSLK